MPGVHSPTQPGLFENTFILVSDGVDDTFDGTDEGLQDRTHRIAVGGELIVRHEGAEVARLTVPEVGHIRLRPFVLWYNRILGWQPAVSDAVVAADVHDIRKRFAQAGITVDWAGKPWGIDVTKVPGVSSNFRGDGIMTQTISTQPATPDELALSAYIKSEYPDSVDSAKDIVIVYSDLLYAPEKESDPNALGKKTQLAHTITPALAGTKHVGPMILTTAKRNLHTMAHEVLHMLLNDLHPPPSTTGRHNADFALERRLWSGGPDGGGVKDRKRMSKVENDHVVPHVQNSPYVKKSR